MADKTDPTDLFQDAIGKQTAMMQKLFGGFMPGGQMQAPPMMGPMMVDDPPIKAATMMVNRKLMSNRARGATDPR